MLDARVCSEFSEQKTEPFSQTEIQARLIRSRMEEFKAMNGTVPLDKFVVPSDQDIRILMRPLACGRSVSPGQRNCTLLALRAEGADQDQATHKVLAVRQTHLDVSFTVTIPDQLCPDTPLCCVLYYDPASDNQVLVNNSHVPFTLSRISQEPARNCGEQDELNPNSNKALAPGTWRIHMDGVDLLDFRILEKRPVQLLPTSRSPSDLSGMSEVVSVTGKRPFVADEDDQVRPEKRHQSSGTPDEEDREREGVIMFLPATKQLVFPTPPTAKGKEVAASTGHPLLDMRPDETLEIPLGPERYTVTKMDPIASTTLSSVFTAEHSDVPGGVIVVKVLKTRSPDTANNEGAAAKNVIRQAQIWLREFKNQEDLEHKSIVRLHGGDARFLSLYMEHVDGRDLSARDTWRSARTDLFAGDRSDAWHILRDIASALHYIHGKDLVHNDIKPGNILYSRDRGAVLCDLGLSTRARNTGSTGGTPWYVPPEFIIMKQRGAPSDVWALGVTMLYAMCKISLPEARGHRTHPQHLHWIIADVHAREHTKKATAVSRMQQWLKEVNTVRNGLDIHDKLERLVYGMLAPHPRDRVTTKDIVSQLFVDRPPDR